MRFVRLWLLSALFTVWGQAAALDAFVVKDIRKDPAALQELVKLGFRATPVALVDGEAVVGFDNEARQKLTKLLGIG